MREAVALGVVHLAFLGIAWLIAIVAAFVIAGRLQSTLAKIGVLIAVCSLPAYIALSVGYERYRTKDNFQSRLAIAKLESTRYQELCAKPQQLTVFRTLPVSGTVDVRIKEARGLYPLDVMNPVWPKKDICWTRASPDACANTRIANVQWEFRSEGSLCAASAPPKECHRMWNFSLPTQVRSEISSIAATTTIETSRGERISPLIERFRVTLHGGDSSALLGETFVYRKDWFGDLGPNPKKDLEPRHCPDRDMAIGKLLDSVFVSGG